MKKGLFLIITLILIGLFCSAGMLTAADTPDTLKEIIVIDGKNYKKDIKGPVNFNHAKHNVEFKVACTECHHEYKDGNKDENLWKKGDPVEKCSKCHDPLKKDGNVKKLMKAFHDNCKKCHKKLAAEGKKAPGKKCVVCHLKK